MREGVLRGLEFTGITPRADFWWFALAVVMLLAFAELLAGVVGPLPLQIATLLVLLYLLTYLTKAEEPIEATPG